MKCEICKKNIDKTFLEKPIGTIVKDKKGKKHTICNECQQKHPKKVDILGKL
jgi:hypothetical protein